ncbi:MAG: hypothetical protein IPJ28_13590 [Betaproteobacteria bacterium]|nr:hypothetical protein [Betaproteobacteria bacterium]
MSADYLLRARPRETRPRGGRHRSPGKARFGFEDRTALMLQGLVLEFLAHLHARTGRFADAYALQ